MSYKTVYHDGFEVIGLGLALESGNQPEKIGQLWQQFFQNEVVEKIPGKVNENLIGLYTDYEGDQTAGMMVVVGAAVMDTELAPEGMVKKSIPAGNYAVFTAEKAEDVGKVWHEIWNTDLKRTFVADFEVYKMDGSPIEIYIGIE